VRITPEKWVLRGFFLGFSRPHFPQKAALFRRIRLWVATTALFATINDDFY